MRPCASLVVLALCVLLVGCREEPSTEQSAPVETAPDTNAPFTPPEIRRAWDSTRTETTVQTATEEVPSQTPPLDPNHGARPSLAPSAAPPAQAPATKPAPPAVAAPAVPAPSAPPPTAADLVGPGGSGEWTIQVGIHKSEEGARAMVAKLAAKGIPAYVVQAASNAGLSGSYWRVRVGPFAARPDAQKYGDKVLVPGGHSFWIDRKSNEAPAAGGTP